MGRVTGGMGKDYQSCIYPNGNRFVDLTETGSCPAPKGLVSFSEVGRRRTETGSWTYALTGSWGHSSLTQPNLK